jgi:outer membrane protein
MKAKVLVLLMIGALAAPVSADAGDWILRLRAINVDPNESSEKIGETGSEVSVDSATTVEVDVTYMLSNNFGIEVIAATTKHDLSASGGDLAGANLGSVKVLPPTAVFQWHPFPGGLFDFYVGAGINYTYFYSYDLSNDLSGLGVTDVKFSNSFGLAGDIGLNVNFGDHFHINGDIKYIQISTDADIKVGSDTLDEVTVDINPWVFGIGVGYRF